MKRVNLALTVLFYCIMTSAGWACSITPKPTDEDMYKGAKDIFIARVLETRLRKYPRSMCEDVEDCAYVEGKYKLVERIKGYPATSGKVVDAVTGPGTCSLGLMAGWYYVFYRNRDNGVHLWGGSYVLGPWIEEHDIELAREIKKPGNKRPKTEG